MRKRRIKLFRSFRSVWVPPVVGLFWLFVCLPWIDLSNFFLVLLYLFQLVGMFRSSLYGSPYMIILYLCSIPRNTCSEEEQQQQPEKETEKEKREMTVFPPLFSSTNRQRSISRDVTRQFRFLLSSFLSPRIPFHAICLFPTGVSHCRFLTRCSDNAALAIPTIDGSPIWQRVR